MAISRAIVYHSVRYDVWNLLTSLSSRQLRPSPESAARTKKFESDFARYLGARHALAFPFARTALYFALKSQGFEEGAEIIMPPITIKPMMDVVLALKLKPVLVDINRDTLCFDLEKLREAITHKTKAIVITYLFGIVPELGQLMSLCREWGLFVVEDFSHNLNATFQGKKLGTFGDVGIYSCSATKTLDAYGGGLAVTDDEAIFLALQQAQTTLAPTPGNRLRSKILRSLVWNLATNKLVFTLATFPMLRLMRKVSPGVEQIITGARVGLKPASSLSEAYFEQFTGLQAKAGLAMLKKVGEEDAKRIANVENIKRSLPPCGQPYPRTLDGCRHVYWQFVVYPPDGVKFKKMLARRGIDTGATNLSLIPQLGIYPEHERPCPSGEYVKRNAFFIPAYGRLSDRDLEKVQAALREALCEKR